MRPRTLDQLGSTTGGVWSRAEALTAVSRGRLQHALATGEWREVLPGALMDGGFEPTALQRAVAAVLATGDELGAARSRIRAVACGRTAARVHGFPLLDDDDPSTARQEHLVDDVHTFRARGGRWTTVEHGARRLDRHRLTLLDGDLVHHPSGLVLTSPMRTACDCARLLAFDAAVALVDHGLHRRLFTADDLAGALRKRTGWPGVRRLAAVVTAADGRAESPAETVARLVLLPALPSLVPQVRVRDRAGRIGARVDLGDEATRFAVEVDGKRGHAGPVMVAKDRRRDRRTADLDWHVERVTWHELRTRAAATRARVAEEHRRWQTRRSL